MHPLVHAVPRRLGQKAGSVVPGAAQMAQLRVTDEPQDDDGDDGIVSG